MQQPRGHKEPSCRERFICRVCTKWEERRVPILRGGSGGAAGGSGDRHEKKKKLLGLIPETAPASRPRHRQWHPCKGYCASPNLPWEHRGCLCCIICSWELCRTERPSPGLQGAGGRVWLGQETAQGHAVLGHEPRVSCSGAGKRPAADTERWGDFI